jgi:outer membrane protein OmpA-like peptidoglycan-associated protein
MEPKTMLKTTSLVIAVTLAGCSSSLPPKELVDARAAYNRAAAGPAAQLDPADLHVAQEKLAQAEHSFDSDGIGFRTRDLAYVAERKAEIADTNARVTEAEQAVNLSKRQVELTQAKSLETARTQLARTREELAAATAAMTQLAALKTVKEVKEDTRGTVITLSGSVLFASSKYELLSSAQETLSNVADALAKGDPNRKIVVQGYTDSQGNDAYNMTLSQNRAETVRSFLISHGIPSDRVTAVGFGPASPVADNASAEGRANNRRVEIIVKPSSEPATSEKMGSETTTSTTSVVH